MNFVKGLLSSISFYGIACVILGIVLIAIPELALNVVCYCVGALIIVQGLFYTIRCFINRSMKLVTWSDVVMAVVLIAFGVLVILAKHFFISLVPYFLGLIIIIGAVANAQKVVYLKKSGYGKWWLVIIPSVISAILGILMMVYPFGTAKVAMIFIGVCLIYQGIMNFLTVFSIDRARTFLARTADSDK